MEAYAETLIDLQRIEPADAPSLIPPFQDTEFYDEQFDKTYASLQRNVWLKSRILALTDAYYLGKLLNGIPDRVTRTEYNRRLTIHYQRMVENTFDLFEYHPEQIQRTQTIDVQRIKKMPRNIVKSLRESLLMNFAGAQRLREGRLLPVLPEGAESDDVTLPQEPEGSTAGQDNYFE